MDRLGRRPLVSHPRCVWTPVHSRGRGTLEEGRLGNRSAPQVIGWELGPNLSTQLRRFGPARIRVWSCLKFRRPACEGPDTSKGCLLFTLPSTMTNHVQLDVASRFRDDPRHCDGHCKHSTPPCV